MRYTVHGLLARTSGSDMTTQRHVTVLRDLDSKRDAEKRTPSVSVENIKITVYILKMIYH